MVTGLDDIPVGVSAEQVAEFCRRWNVGELALFGSVLRDDFGPDSDVDVLVSPGSEARWSLYDWVDMRRELEVMFGRPVDLVSRRALRNPYRRHTILGSSRVIYAAPR